MFLLYVVRLKLRLTRSLWRTQGYLGEIRYLTYCYIRNYERWGVISLSIIMLCYC